MARNRAFWSLEKRQSRATVDALREVLGYAPLYNQHRVQPESWLSGLADLYYQQRPTQTAKRGSGTARGTG